MLNEIKGNYELKNFPRAFRHTQNSCTGCRNFNNNELLNNSQANDVVTVVDVWNKEGNSSGKIRVTPGMTCITLQINQL